MSHHATKEELRAAAAATLAAIEGKTLGPRERMALPLQEMPSQDPSIRVGNMDEVAVGYSPEQARVEASRCLQCKTAPCVAGCPVGIDIPRFLAKAAEGDFEGSLEVIKESSLQIG